MHLFMESTYNPLLHIEADENYILLFQRALAAAGISHPLQIVRNGARAVDYLLGQNPYERRDLYPLPSLILLNLDLPLLSGLQFLKWRQTQPEIQHIPVLVLTSSQQFSDLAAAYEAGANSYLVKPLTFAGLLEMVNAIQQFWLMHNTFSNPPAEADEPRIRTYETAKNHAAMPAAIGI